MQPFVSPLIFNAHALPTDHIEPHAKVGNHLRVNTHPLLGLPAAPFIVYRAVVDNLKTLNTRRDAVFTDKNGHTLSTPITVTPENPVTAHIVLAPGETCLWAQVDAISKERLDGNNQPGNPRLVIPGPSSSGITRPSRLRPNLGNRIDSNRFRLDQPVANTIASLTNFNIRDRIRDGLINLLPANKLTCEAFMQSAMGPASVGTRSEMRYAFSAPGIITIEIYGAGRVTGVHWIEARDDQKLKYEPYTIMTLPHSGGERYLSITSAKSFAEQHVETQAPKRRPLQETTNAPPPNTAPLADIPFEKARVKSLLTTIDDDLESLINDVSETPYEQVITEKIINEDNVEVGSSMMSRLGRFFQSLADPGTATYAGFKLLDDDWVEVEDRIIFYHIDAFFRDLRNDRQDKELSPAEVLVQSGIDHLSPKSRGQKADALMNLFVKNTDKIKNSELNKDTVGTLLPNDQYTFMGTVAIADRGAPLDKIRPPLITATIHKTWLPAVPPDALREVEVTVADVRVAGLLAAGKRTPATGPSTDYGNINKQNNEGFHLPLVLSLDVDGSTSEPVSEPGIGFIADRNAKAPEIRYFIAQQDRFGRWSEWGARNADSGPRPKPPRPEFQGFYQQPSIIDAEANKGGRVRVKVSVPEPESLAPGSHLLDQVRLIVFDETLATSTNHEQAEASKVSFASDPNGEYVVIKFDGPVLQKTELRKLRLTAHWIDTNNQLSAVSEPQTLKLYDPRAPEQLLVPDKLQYSARPDVTGLSWVEHRWSADSTQVNFGIYYTDENRLRSYLKKEGETALEVELNATENAAAVATVFRNNAALFPDHLFERLRDVQVDYNSGETGFRHAVSGSLRILNLYKIAAESGSGAKPVLTDLPLIIYGVPNSDPPQRPTLTVEPVAPIDEEPDFVTRVTINLVAGMTQGKTWRLRRSSVESHNLNRMPIVTTELLGEIDEQSGRQTAEFRDTGSVQISDTAILKPWTRYTWVAEVQGKPESGSEASGVAVPGRWSSPSDPVSLVLVPLEPPETITIIAINGTAVSGGLTDVTLELSHPDALNGGEFGSYRLRISRRTDEASALEILREQDISGKAPFSVSGVSNDNLAEKILFNTEYVVDLIDPLGRSSGSSRITVS